MMINNLDYVCIPTYIQFCCPFKLLMQEPKSTDNVSNISKPTDIVSRIISLFGFQNPEDVMYFVARDHFKYMNYGMFAPSDAPEHNGFPEEAVNYLELFRLCNPRLEKGLEILEIGCGFGYGAQVVYNAYKPKSLLSIDRARNAILYAQKNFKDSAVNYRFEDFTSRLAPENSFDVIYTVESGGRFPGQENFDWAYKMLKPNRVFLVASINPTHELARKRSFAKNSGFVLHNEKDVTPQVIAYLDSEKKAKSFYSAFDNMPFYISTLSKIFMKSIKEFARMPGSKTHARLGKEEFYVHFCFKKE